MHSAPHFSYNKVYKPRPSAEPRAPWPRGCGEHAPLGTPQSVADISCAIFSSDLPRVFVPNVVVLVLGFGFALAVMPETRGKSLEKIAQEMSATD